MSSIDEENGINPGWIRRDLFRIGGAALAGTTLAVMPRTEANAQVAARNPVALREAMRKLWEDHIVYTCNFIISALANGPDVPAVTARLMRNQDEIGGAIKPYYGEAAGNQLAGLLREHIMLTAEVVKAAPTGNPALLASRQQQALANAQQIADFLSRANPNWKRAAVLSMLQRHLDLTTQEATSRLRGDWAGDIAAYDQNHTHMLMFSDMLADGIERQPPQSLPAYGSSVPPRRAY
jgi:hypothetical protein